MECPICGFGVANARGLASHFRHQASTHPDYEGWVADRKWEGKVEGVDYVRCLECGFRGASLTKHLQLHDIKADEYRARHGSDAILRPSVATERIRSGVTAAHAAGRMGHDDTKEVLCPGCGRTHEVSKYLVPGTHDIRCPECKAGAEVSRWEGKVEGDDYVACRECGHMAENLTSHVQNTHPALVGRYHVVHGASPMVAWKSAVRDKSALKGRVLSEETKTKMSETAGRWNAGLTKETDERVATAAEKMLGKAPWSKGLTKEEHPSLASNSEKQTGREHTWTTGLEVPLTETDLRSFLDDEGRVDVLMAVEVLDVSWPTVRRCVREAGLEVTDTHVLERQAASVPLLQRLAQEKIIRLKREDIEPYLLKNGKVLIGAAVRGLHHSFSVVARECDRLGFETFRRNIKQTYFLDAVARVLGGATYVQEWRSRAFVNSKTGHMYKYDGFYTDIGLLAEFDGYLHYTFPNNRLPDESYRQVFEDILRRDAEKTRYVEESGKYKLLRVREDEPFTNPAYLAGRLVQMGVLRPDQVSA